MRVIIYSEEPEFDPIIIDVSEDDLAIWQGMYNKKEILYLHVKNLTLLAMAFNT